MIMKALHTIYTSFAKRLALTLTLILTFSVGQIWSADYNDVGTSLTNGKSYILVAGGSYAITASNPSSGWIGKTDVSNLITNQTLKTDLTDIVWIATDEGDGKWSFKNGNNYITNNSGNTYRNMACSSTKSIFTIKNDKIYSTGSTNKWLQGLSSGFRMYNSSQSGAKETFVFYELTESCTNSVAVSAGSKTNVNSISFSSSSIATCSSTATDRQVTITVTPNTGYEMTSGSRLTFTKTSGTATANYVSGPTASGSSYQFVYRFNQNDKGVGTFSASCTAKKTTISFDQNGGEGGQTAPVTAIYDQPMPTPITLPTRYGHTFGGYYDGVGGTGTQYYTAEGASARTWDKISADITLYAKWTEKLTNYRTSCSTKDDPNISWSANSCVATMEVDNEFPTLTNPYELSITYLSSDHTVATIDENGTITLLKSGTTTITASYEEDEYYLSASTSYELTVEAANCKWVETEIGEIEPEDEVVVTMTKGVFTWALNQDYYNNGDKYPLATTLEVNGNEITEIYDKIKWNISGNATDGYILYPNGQTATWLYCTGSNNTVKIGEGTDKYFVIENGYLKSKSKVTTEGTQVDAFLGVSTSTNSWRHYPNTTTSVISGQTLKLYKKTCLPANKFWIDYELANVTCTNTPPHSQIDQTGEYLLLEFSANDGYKLPETISVKMGETEIGNDENYCVWDKEAGALLIAAEQITDNITITIEGCERLATPTNLSVTNITSTSARLSWKAVTNADEYRVCIMDGETQLDELTTTETYVDVMNLKKNSFYTWDVVAEANDYCESLATAWIEFTTLDVYTVTFNSNGGTDVESQTVDHGSKATKPANPTKTGYTFAGWYTEADAEFDFDTPITSATDLYAKWDAKQYTITFLKQWGDGGTGTATVHFDNNDFSVSPIIVPTRNGYTFGGYYTAESGAGTQLIDVSGAWLNAPTYIEGGKWVYADNLTLYAKWTQNFTITWMANGQLYHTQTAMMGTAIAKPDNPKANELACDDKVFVGWLDKAISGSTNEEPTFVTDFGTIQAAKTYHAVFATLTGTPSNDYNQITDINDLTDGEYVIAYGYNTSSPSIILKAEAKDATKLAATSLAPTNNKYTSPAAANIWEIKKNGDNYSIYNAATQKYVEATTTPSVGLSDNPEYYTISWNSSYSYWKIQIATSTHYWFVGYISGETKYFQSYNVDNNRYRIQLYKNASTAVYSDYVTTCVEIPTPHWEGAEIDNANIAVDCGAISVKSNASKITFDKNYDLTYPITLTASEGFLLSTNKQNDVYEQSVTVTPVQSGDSDNKGKITQSVYVRADATGKNTNFDGTITISGDQLAEDQILEVHAIVDCPQYTLTFYDQGQTKTVEGFAGTSVVAPEPWAGICTEPIQYVFDGWATAPVNNGTTEYEKVDFSTFTMPNNNTTILYAVYRYAEEGGEPVNGYVKVTEALLDWSGDYVIVDETAKMAIKSEYKTNTNSNKTLKAEDVTLNNNMVVSPSEDVIWQIRKKGNYYTMYNETAKKYAYITQDKSEAAGLDDNPQDLMISFNNSNATIYSETYLRCFSYYDTNIEWRTYSTQNYSTGALYRLAEKSIRYTSFLVCGTIEAEDAIVTSTVDQTVKVYVPITLEYSDVASITGTSDNEAFTVVTKNDVAVGESTIEVHYKPTAYVNTANQEETATITLTTSNGATTTFNVTGRCLPENFVIAAKAGGEWVALTAKVSNGTQVAVPIIVDDKTAPTKAIVALNTCQYKLLGLTTKNRFDVNGTAVHLYSTQTEKVLNASTASGTSTYLNTNATHENAESSGNALFYEWQLVTEDLKKYTITNSNTTNKSNTRLGYSAATGQWGMYVNNVNVNQELYLLPIESHFTELNVEVMEWGTNSMALRIDGTAPSKLDVTLGENTNTVTLANLNSGNISDIYKAEGIDLTTNDCEIMKIVDNANPNSGTLIRKPILVNTTEAVSSTYRTKLTDDYCAHCDIVILKDAKLTADQGINNHTSFAKIYVYPGGKLILDGKSLGAKQQVYLRGGYSWLNSKYALPELYLNGTIDFNGSGNIIYDYYIQNYKYYQFSLPYDVQLAKVTDESGADDFPVWVKHYNGALRAEDPHATSWEWYPSENGDASASFYAGRGYIIAAQPRQEGNTANRPLSIIRFPLGNKVFNTTNGLESDLSIITKAHGIVGYNAGTVTANNVGWNFIGNPFMSTWKGDIGYKQLAKHPDENNWDGTYHWVDSDVKYITIMSAESGSDYYQYIATKTELKPFFPFYLQETAVEGSGEITFATSQRIQKAPAMLSVESPREAFVQIEITAEGNTDQTGMFIGDRYSDDIDFDDYEKMFGSSTDKPKVWIMHENIRMAFEAMTESTAATYIPLGYRAPKIGKYIFAINEEASKVSEVEAVYLTDNQTGVTDFDLLSSAYEFESNGELYNDSRFTIRIVLRDESSSTVTGVDNVLHFNSNHPCKFIYQDKMYILRNGVIYDAMGKQVQTINK